MNALMKLIKDIVLPLITVLTGVMVVYLNNSVSRVESKLKESQELRAERESYHSYDLKIYDKVVESLESNDRKRQQVAQALVVVMASDSFRVKLLNVLEKAAVDTVRREVTKIIEKENTFKVEEEIVEKHVLPNKTFTSSSDDADWKDYNYDIFWCEKSGENAQQFAAKVEKQLKENGATGRIRIRQLPESVNSRGGYQIAGYVIRANQNEIKIAEELQKRGRAILGKDFIITFSGQQTPAYVSAFICP